MSLAEKVSIFGWVHLAIAMLLPLALYFRASKIKWLQNLWLRSLWITFVVWLVRNLFSLFVEAPSYGVYRWERGDLSYEPIGKNALIFFIGWLEPLVISLSLTLVILLVRKFKHRDSPFMNVSPKNIQSSH